jgi:hypothetical protein
MVQMQKFVWLKVVEKEDRGYKANAKRPSPNPLA